MKLSEKNLQLILILCIVVVAFLAYQFGYVNFKGKADKIALENRLSEARLAELAGKEAQRSEYVDTINGAGDKINEILSKYGPMGTKEKTIVFVSRVESETDTKISSIGFSEDENVYTSTQVDENSVPVIRGYKRQVNVEYQCKYENMKRLFKFINSYPERTNIESFTMMYDQETGGINGSMVINQYSVDDANHVYEIPAISGISLGKENIFY